jgi:hypothetical protein
MSQRILQGMFLGRFNLEIPTANSIKEASEPQKGTELTKGHASLSSCVGGSALSR